MSGRGTGHQNTKIPKHIPHKASSLIALDCVECLSTQEVFILPPQKEREREAEMKNTRGLA